MAEPEEKEEGFEVLEALAKIGDVKDFRLGEFMREHGMNPSQPTIFYRELIKELRKEMSFVDSLLNEIGRLEEAIAQLKAELSPKDERIKALEARLHTLEEEAHKKAESLEDRRHQLETTISQLKEKAGNYDGVKEFLKGEFTVESVGGLYRLVADMNEEILYANLGIQSSSNPAIPEIVRQRLRDDLMKVLKIPKDTLELENIRLKEQIDAIVGMLKQVYRGGGSTG